MAKFEVYVAGDSARQRGPGGWTAVIPIKNKQAVVIKGGEYTTTKNRMAILGVIEGLKFCKLAEATEVELHVQNEYVGNVVARAAFRGLIPAFEFKAGSTSTSKQPLEYPELVEECLTLIAGFDGFTWVHNPNGNRGASGKELLKACDVLACGVYKEREFSQTIDTVGMAALGI